MQPNITVLSHVSTDVTQPALYLTAKNGQKYLIGRIGEGFQRSLAQTKTKTSKLSGLFLTGQVRWRSVSGVPGMLLSFGERELALNKIHCGPGKPLARAAAMIDSWQNFSFHTPLVVEPDASGYSDENLEIMPLTIDDSTSFVVKMKPVRGRFNVAKAKALGVPPGPNYAKLGNGEPVTLNSGKVVLPSDVLGAAPVPATALVLDLPTLAHVETAIAQLRELKQTWKDTDLKVVYYFFEKGVDLSSPLIQELMQTLSDREVVTRHFISHPSTSPDFNTLTDLSDFQAAFRGEFPANFSPLYSAAAAAQLPVPNAHILKRLHVFSVEPRETENTKTKKQRVEEIPAEPLNEEPSAGLPFVPESGLVEPEIVTLGTGASAPSKYRNVSSTLVRTPNGAVLFDCGEGTYNTLGRLYGPEARSRVLAEIRVQYISHMHADHHLGGMQVLKGWIDTRKALLQKGAEIPQLIVASPIYFHKFVKIWSELDGFSADVDEHVILVDLDSVCFGNRYSEPGFFAQADLDKANASLAGLRIEACKARHCPYSYNGSVTIDGCKMSYSGDSRPNAFFADTIGQNSDILVHEATHEDDLHEEAVKKRHSTISEALQIANRMNAKNTVLTHISQRYPRLPTLDKELATGEDRYVYFGFDCMHAKLSEIKGIQQMIPKMSALLTTLEGDESD